jgi:hypothetical protein
MSAHEALLRVVNADGVTYLALPDVAALLLDAAASLDGSEVTAADALRSLSTGLARYGG